MALDIRVGISRMQVPTSGAVAFTDAVGMGGATPVGALFIYGVHSNVAGTADSNHFGMGVGACDGTRQWAVSAFSENNVASSDDSRVSSDGDCMFQIFDGAVLYIAQFSSFAANTVNVNFTTGNATPYDIICIMWGGADVQAYANDMAVASGDNVITDPNFAGDLIFCASTDQAFNETGASELFLSFGAAARDASPPNSSINLMELDNVAAGNASTYISSSKIRTELFGASEQSAITAFSSQGFTLNSDSASDQPLGYLYLRLGGGSVKVNNFTTRTSQGLQPYTLGHRPIGAIFGITSAAALDTVYQDSNAGGFGIGACHVGAVMSAYSGAIEDAADPTDTQTNARDHALQCGVGDVGAAIIADLVSMDMTGLTLNYTTTNATARHGFIVSFGEAPNPPPEWNPKHDEKPGKGNPNPPGKDKPGQRRDFLWREYGEIPSVSSAIFASGATPPFIFPAVSADEEVRRPQGPYFPIAQFFTAPNYKKERRRRVEDVEDDLRETYRRATEADSPSEQREAIREVKRAAATALSIAKRDEDLELMELAQSIIDMRKLRDMQEYLRKVGEVLAREQREQDDLDAFMMIASLS